MDSLKKFITSIRQDPKNKILFGAFILLGLICLVLPGPSNPPAAAAKSDTAPTVSVDTYIPNGYVLAPIELANANSLGSLLGENGGVVDLYLPKGKMSLKVASKLKILKAPYNPDQYAVLVREAESSRLLNYAGPFIAVVQNPNEKGQKFENNSRPSIAVDYQN